MSDLRKRLLRWMLPGPDRPADLPLEHPAQADIAYAADEIERLTTMVESLRLSAHAEKRGRQTAEAENELLRAIQSAAKTVLETFERDEAQGYRSRDRQFAIEVLRPAFEQKGSSYGKTG